MDDLLPCPNPWCISHCRRDPEIFELHKPIPMDHADFPNKWTVACPVCPMHGPPSDTKEGAMAAWNTRRPDLAAEVERLRGENAQIKSLVAELDQRIEALGGCSDGSCVIKRPKGMHTNGGCRCPRDGGKMICFTAYVEYFRRMARAALGEQP